LPKNGHFYVILLPKNGHFPEKTLPKSGQFDVLFIENQQIPNDLIYRVEAV